MPLRFSLPSPRSGIHTTTLLRPRHRHIQPRHGSLQLFHSTAHPQQTHYETLNLQPTATPADIKRSFYALSKTHHPDLNPNDPTASERFVKISDAYHVLGSPSERKKYDRDHLPQQQQQQEYQAGPQRGSYSSTSPAGGRPASGLSKRKTRFYGPPPSFYRSGGWGYHEEKRRAQAEDTASSAKARSEHHNDAGPQSGYAESEAAAPGEGQAGGTGPGQYAYGAGGVPHFDQEGHLRTHSNHEQRRQRRARLDREGLYEIPTGLLGPFLLISGVISLGLFLPALIFEQINAKPTGKALK